MFQGTVIVQIGVIRTVYSVNRLKTEHIKDGSMFIFPGILADQVWINASFILLAEMVVFC